MQAYIGIIMLAGIVVSNAILLVDYINTLRRRDGMPLREAVELGGRTRLRPILMTSIATGLGLVPMALLSVMVSRTTSYDAGSSAPAAEAAEAIETSCSQFWPPPMTATLIRFMKGSSKGSGADCARRVGRCR